MTGIPETLIAEVAKIMGVHAKRLHVSLRNPLDFQSNRLYDIRGEHVHCIAKEYLRTEEQHLAPWREYQSLQYLSALDVAPQPVFFAPDLAPVVVYRHMDGVMWDRRAVAAADLADLAATWLRIHAVPVDWMSRDAQRALATVEQEICQQFADYHAWTVAEFPAGRAAADLCLQLLEPLRAVVRELLDHAPVLCFCRSDPRFANVIQRPGKSLGLVDWEDGGLRDPAREVADLLMHPNQEDLLGRDAWQAFLTPYMAVRSRIDPEMPRRLHLFLAVYPVYWLMILLRHGMKLAATGRLAGWSANGLPGNLRLRRYLARAMAWPDTAHEAMLARWDSLVFFPAHAEAGMPKVTGDPRRLCQDRAPRKRLTAEQSARES